MNQKLNEYKDVKILSFILPEMLRIQQQDLGIFYRDHAVQALYIYVVILGQLQHHYLHLEE